MEVAAYPKEHGRTGAPSTSDGRTSVAGGARGVVKPLERMMLHDAGERGKGSQGRVSMSISAETSHVTQLAT